MTAINKWPQFRILHAAFYESQLQALPMSDSRTPGYRVRSFDVGSTLFDPATAVIERDYGVVSGEDVPFGLDLTGHHILIQKDYRDEGANEPDWQTDYWGIVEAAKDNPYPGSDKESGTVQYHCVSGIELLRRFYLTKHQWSFSGSAILSAGHPGYNMESEYSFVVGNRVDDVNLLHTPPGPLAKEWTIKQAIQNALVVAEQQMRASPNSGQPQFPFTFEDDTNATDIVRYIKVDYRETVFDMLLEVLDRRRISAIPVLEYARDLDVGDTLFSSLEPKLVMRATEHDSITYAEPVGGTEKSILGAAALETAIAELDVIGDPKVKAGSFELSEIKRGDYEAIVTESDPIEIMFSFQPDARWTSAEATAYDSFRDATGLDGDGLPQFASAYSVVGLPHPFSTVTMPAGGASPITLATRDNGVIYYVTGQSVSPLTIELTDDLPILAGYDYTGTTIAPYDSATDLLPTPIPIGVYEFDGSGSDWRVVDLADAETVSASRAGAQGNDIQLIKSSPRLFEDYAVSDVRLTVCARLPNRLRFETANTAGSETARQGIKVINVPGLRLVLAHRSAIIGYDETDIDGGFYRALFAGCNSVTVNNVEGAGDAFVYYRIRDDRNRLAAVHAQAVARYLRERRTLAFDLEGIYPLDWQGGQVAVGKVIKAIRYNGRTEEVNTVISRITYDNVQGSARIVTSYADRDWRL